ncbi:MAG: alpha-D-ribose 1-methylphosphonate 5-triphosphate diphosphatase [Alphaproteobacteria bacterium]
MSREQIFTNARIVTADAVLDGTAVVRGGCIAAVETGRAAAPSAMDLEGDYLLPGLVELHTDNLEKHFVPRPGVDWPGPVAAAAHDAQIASAGITTVFDALALGEIYGRSGRVKHLYGMAEALRWGRGEGHFRAEHRLHLRCEITAADVIGMFESLADDPAVGLVSLMDHTPGQRQFVDVDKYRVYYQGRWGFSDGEMERFIEERIAEQRKYGVAHRAMLAGLCRERGLAVASHDDACPAHVDEAVADGAVIAEFPTTVEAAEAARGAGLSILMGAPNVVLGGSHSGNVSAADLADRGLLDVLSSDYVPTSLMHGIFLLADRGMDLPVAVGKASLEPARRVDLNDRGEIAEGKRGDLVRVRHTGGGPVVRAVWRGGERVA